MKVHYNPKLKEKARKLRKSMTLGEVLLWNQLKGKQLGYDFHRQKPIDQYIVDFVCMKPCLIIEVDGGSHDYRENDMARQQKLESLGWTVVRVSENEVRRNIQGVVDWIKQTLARLEQAKRTSS